MKKTKVFRNVAFTLLTVVVAVLATATVLEKYCGRGVSTSLVYRSWWFVALWLLTATAATGHVIASRLYRRPLTLCLHFALLLILAGAFTTWVSSRQGSIILMPDGTAVSRVVGDGCNDFDLPFGVKLLRFEVVNYAGTPTPMDFVSKVAIVDNGGEFRRQVSMNRVLNYRNYRFFQSGYDTETGSATLAVQHDPAGIAVSYCGYLLLLVSFVLFFFDRHSGFRRLLKQLKNGAAVCLLLAAVSPVAARGAPKTVSLEVACRLDSLYVLYNGRVCPFSTLTAHLASKLTGKVSFNGMTSTQIIAGEIFFPDSWHDVPFIKVKSAAVREALGITGRMACVDDFYTPELQLKLQPMISAAIRGEARTDERGLAAVNEQFAILNMARSGELIKIFPVQEDNGLRWYSPADRLPETLSDEEYIFFSKGFGFLNELIQKGDNDGAVAFLSKLRKYQQKQAGDLLPGRVQFNAEILYNKLNYNRLISIAAVSAGFLAFMLFCVAFARGSRWRRAVVAGSAVAVSVLWLYLAITIVLRGVAGSHVPLGNGNETMHFMAWATCTLSLLLGRRVKLLFPAGLLVSGCTLLVAMMGEANPQVTLLMPVLQSPLLCLHVTVVMLAYSMLALLMMNGIAAMILRRDVELVARLATMGRVMLYPAVMLLATGIFIGAVWANVSWGRYWGWDPKEVWALITLLVYCLPLHARSLPRLASPRNFHIFSIVAFTTVMITYFGVNFLLGGKHAYV